MIRTLLLLFTTALLASAISVGLGAIAPAPAPAATGGYVAKCGGGQIFLNATEKQSFALHNKTRRENDLKPLCLHPKLQASARAHSKDMVKRSYYDHATKAGTPVHPKLKAGMSTPDRMTAFGYRWSSYGENIGFGYGTSGTPTILMNKWKKSPDHRRNIMSKRFTQIGVGTYFGSTYKLNGETYHDVTMYTVKFGRPF